MDCRPAGPPMQNVLRAAQHGKTREPREAERKPDGPQGGRAAAPSAAMSLWYMIAIGIGMLLLTMWFNMDGGVELEYSQYVALLKKMSEEKDPAKHGEVKIKVAHERRLEEGRVLRLGPHRHRRLTTSRSPARSSASPSIRKPNEVVRTESFHVSRRGLTEGGRPSAAESARRRRRGLSRRRGPSPWRMWMPTLVMTALIVMVIFIMMRRLGGAGSAMAFGRSRGKLYAQEDIGVTFEDVAGIDEAVEELREVVEFLKHAREVPGPRRPHSQGRAAGRPAGHRQDAAGQGHRRRGGRAVLQPLRLRLRRDVRRRRRRPRPRHVPAGRGQGPLHHLHRRAGRPGQDPRHRASSAGTTSASRRSTPCWSRWTASTPTAA